MNTAELRGFHFTGSTQLTDRSYVIVKKTEGGWKAMAGVGLFWRSQRKPL